MKKQPPQGITAFIVIWIGQFISIIGSGMTRFALGIWVLQKTNSVTSFTLILFFSTLMGGLALPLAGVIGDRFNRRYVMIVTDTIAAIATLVILMLLLNDQLVIWHIYLAVSIQAVAGNIQFPAYSAAIPMLIPKKHLSRANGAMQIAGSFSRIFIPILAAALLGFFKLQGVIAVDLISFSFAVIALFFVRIPEPQRTTEGEAAQGTVQYEMSYGFRYIWQRRGLLSLLLYFATINIALGTTSILMTPLILSFANEQTLGWVLATISAGALAGSVIMTVWGGPKRRMYGIMFPIFLCGVGMLMISLRPDARWVALGGVIAMGALPIAGASSRTIWQTKIEPDLQGRISAIRMMVAQFTLPIAYLLAGPIVDRILSPAMQEGGRLAPIFGNLIGTGEGRGIALLILLVSIIPIISTIVGYAYPRLRFLEDELPDQLFPVAQSSTS